MIETHAWQAGLREAADISMVTDAIMRAVHRIPAGLPQSLQARFTPRRLDSREDVEHWGRRLEGRNEPGHAAMREIFAAALHRLDEIGPKRRRAPRPAAA